MNVIDIDKNITLKLNSTKEEEKRRFYLTSQNCYLNIEDKH